MLLFLIKNHVKILIAQSNEIWRNGQTFQMLIFSERKYFPIYGSYRQIHTSLPPSSYICRSSWPLQEGRERENERKQKKEEKGQGISVYKTYPLMSCSLPLQFSFHFVHFVGQIYTYHFQVRLKVPILLYHQPLTILAFRQEWI